MALKYLNGNIDYLKNKTPNNSYKIMINFLTKSNRYKHLIVGFIIYIIMFLIQIFEFNYNENLYLLYYSVNSLITTFIAMCSVEYIQTTFNCKWDWIDVIFGIFVGLLSTVIILII